MKKLALSVILAASILTAIMPVSASVSDKPQLSSQAALVFEPSKGQIVYEKNKSTKYSCFLAGDILTVLLALEKGDPMSTQVTISKSAASVPGDKMYYEIGSKVALEDLLFAVVLKGASDAAYAIAEYVAPTSERFIEMMTAKATELNMKNTSFKATSGFYPQIQTTTAFDISLLMRYAMSFPKFAEAFSSRAVPMSVNGRTQTVVNQNRFFWLYDDVTGGMAQYSTSSLQDAVIMVKRDNTIFMAVVVNGLYEKVYDDARAAFDYAYANFNTDLLVKKNDVITSAVIGNQEIDLVSGKDTFYTYPVGESYIKDISVDIKPGLTLPIKTGEIAGTAKYLLKDGTVVEVSLFPAKDVDVPKSALAKYFDRLKENGDILFVIYVLIGLLLVTGAVTVRARSAQNQKS